MNTSLEPKDVASPGLDWWWVILVCAGAALSVTLIMWRKRKTTGDFIEALTLKWHIAIPPYHRALPQLLYELARARRYEHSSTVVVMGLLFDQAASFVLELLPMKRNGTISSHLVSLLIGTILRDNLRDSDLVTYDATRGYYVLLLTETSARGAEQAVARVHELVLKRTGGRLCAGIAEFPAQGLTIDDLVQHALHGAAPPVVVLPAAGEAIKNGNGTQRSDSLTGLERL